MTLKLLHSAINLLRMTSSIELTRTDTYEAEVCKKCPFDDLCIVAEGPRKVSR